VEGVLRAGRRVLRRAIPATVRDDRVHQGQHEIRWGFGESEAEPWARGGAISAGRCGGTVGGRCGGTASSNLLR
jgi:hypothetical protein